MMRARNMEFKIKFPFPPPFASATTTLAFELTIQSEASLAVWMMDTNSLSYHLRSQIMRSRVPINFNARHTRHCRAHDASLSTRGVRNFDLSAAAIRALNLYLCLLLGAMGGALLFVFSWWSLLCAGSMARASKSFANQFASAQSIKSLAGCSVGSHRGEL